MLSLILQILAAYLIGSIPTGFWIGKARGIDVRKVGSCSTGATNVYRSVGKVEGILTMILDLLKGYLPVIYSQKISADLTFNTGNLAFDLSDVAPVVVALTAIIGHSKSIFLGFGGGKSAATGLGTMLALSLPAGGLTFLTWITIVFISRIVSLASMTAAAANVGYMILFHVPRAFVVYSIIGCLYVTLRHKANIKRLMNGTEPRITGAKKEGS
ncbi:MAG TPA: glycerol-3-phosphate 1-O-acyltransferase PlsY [Candidatus Obscuribacter sp.]|nr:glycerol-3-phosphate 1-O-acyltransferase PlsY [Candidatus Obscuribacter sp.]MBK9278234.1 glycerol-3-phosphate 1-O-acyltransferase PlsY [Candidatus Obscuribacter sp.]MBL8081155.1 glycerol-3-phosphate 1-O-acyltransferase PlsY [Candidatus Obscuribacter sp.]HND68442.1 glycerol-3-phosphate 1-O-acyltransferase PlsY [Candidatus Obscuribacter sp.]HNG74416.1 glycerol-3-phosphate 1-O-acyltransferase PlsY [Candidatus Obscuribacter sp.]